MTGTPVHHSLVVGRSVFINKAIPGAINTGSEAADVRPNRPTSTVVTGPVMGSVKTSSGAAGAVLVGASVVGASVSGASVVGAVVAGPLGVVVTGAASSCVVVGAASSTVSSGHGHG